MHVSILGSLVTSINHLLRTQSDKIRKREGRSNFKRYTSNTDNDKSILKVRINLELLLRLGYIWSELVRLCTAYRW